MTDHDAAMAKLFATETLGRVTDRAVQVFGGMGLMASCRSSASGATPGSNGSGTAPARSSATSSLRCCAATAPGDGTSDGSADGRVHTEVRDAVLVITLDVPKANAINVATSQAMYDAFGRLRDDPGSAPP